MRSRLFAAATAAVFATAPAIAATPILSGSYVYSSRTLCQPTIVVQYAQDANGQTFVNGLNLTTPEGSSHEVGLATFDPSTQTVSYKGTKDSGDNILLKLSNGTQGAVFSEKSESGSGAYSNTATTVTINGSTYAATYGKNTKGISQFFALVGLDSAGCTRQWEFTLK